MGITLAFNAFAPIDCDDLARFGGGAAILGPIIHHAFAFLNQIATAVTPHKKALHSLRRSPKRLSAVPAVQRGTAGRSVLVGDNLTCNPDRKYRTDQN
jgi:hypothetical protein